MESSSSLLPQMADAKLYEGEGGSYYSWSSGKFPLLSEAKLGAGRLSLQPRGFALPHYADSAKIGYVLQGSCTVGLVFPNTSEEKVITIKKGDAIPVALGSVSWWFNGGDSEVIILFLGETTKAHISGQFTYFFLTGTLGVLGGFSTEFISKAYNVTEEEAKLLAKSQPAALIVKLKEEIKMPRTCKEMGKMTYNLESGLPDVEVKHGGSVTVATSANFPAVLEVQLSGKRVKLDPGAMLAPEYTTDSSAQMIYIVYGSGRIQIVGLNGQTVLDAEVQTGHLLVVPRLFAAAMVADGEGVEYFSVITSPKPAFEQLAGNTSVWEALSPHVLQSALGVTPELEELFKTKIKRGKIIIPPRV